MLGSDEIDKREGRPAVRRSALYLGLRNGILGHGIDPGTKLPEDELGAIYSVSRTVVRAALQALAHDRLVRLEPNRGAFVAKPTRTEAREVFEARALVDAIAKRSALDASELMTSHLVDLLSGLDLSERQSSGKKLADILMGRSPARGSEP